MKTLKNNIDLYIVIPDYKYLIIMVWFSFIDINHSLNRIVGFDNKLI